MSDGVDTLDSVVKGSRLTARKVRELAEKKTAYRGDVLHDDI